MANRAKQKGTAWETACKLYAQQIFPTARRRALAGSADEGDLDLDGARPTTIECKAVRSWSPYAWVQEAVTESWNVGDDCIGAVWAKVPGKGQPQDGVILMHPDDFLWLLKEAGY
jgi:hypothetical protein